MITPSFLDRYAIGRQLVAPDLARSSPEILAGRQKIHGSKVAITLGEAVGNR
jgi:hypothetical protein